MEDIESAIEWTVGLGMGLMSTVSATASAAIDSLSSSPLSSPTATEECKALTSARSAARSAALAMCALSSASEKTEGVEGGGCELLALRLEALADCRSALAEREKQNTALAVRLIQITIYDITIPSLF